MIKLIKRTTDNKFIQSVENDLWVDKIEEAFEMTYNECEAVKTELLKTYQQGELKEVINMQKIKPITLEEKTELLSLFARKK
jgi:hypothetical protein